jgi:hypothetical protein
MSAPIIVKATRLNILVYDTMAQQFYDILIKICNDKGKKLFKKRIFFQDNEFFLENYLIKVKKSYSSPDLKVKLTFTFKKKIDATTGSTQVFVSSLRYEEWKVLPAKKRKFSIAELYKPNMNLVLIGEPKNKRARL